MHTSSITYLRFCLSMRCLIPLSMQETPSIKMDFYMIWWEELFVFACNTWTSVYTLKCKHPLILHEHIKLLYFSEKLWHRLPSTWMKPINHSTSMLWWFHSDCEGNNVNTWQTIPLFIPHHGHKPTMRTMQVKTSINTNILYTYPLKSFNKVINF